MLVGKSYIKLNGLEVIDGRTDPSNLRQGSGCVMFNVECYGGGLWILVYLVSSSFEYKWRYYNDVERAQQKFIKIDEPIAGVSSFDIVYSFIWKVQRREELSK